MSACTSCSIVPRLESRIESLERENKLLEAALMGVLKSSDTLNRCPCVILSRTQEARVEGAGMTAEQTSGRETTGSGQIMERVSRDRTGVQQECHGVNEVTDGPVNTLEMFFENRLRNELVAI
jgi:hypothetical protein